MIRHRILARFTKQGDLRQIGHQDLARCVERLLRRADIKLSMSEGFHPRPRLSFPLALSVGVAATDEIVEFDIAEDLTLDQLRAKLAANEMPGLQFTSIEAIPMGQKRANVESVELRMPLPTERRAAAQARTAEFMAQDKVLVAREGRRAPVDVRGDVLALDLDDTGLRLSLAIHPEGSARAREVLTELGLADLEHEGYFLTRTAVRLHSEAPARPAPPKKPPLASTLLRKHRA
jgi:radical SAM-linked protein